jgi:hypothetical protein
MPQAASCSWAAWPIRLRHHQQAANSENPFFRQKRCAGYFAEAGKTARSSRTHRTIAGNVVAIQPDDGRQPICRTTVPELLPGHF